jgi:5'-nucleotidase
MADGINAAYLGLMKAGHSLVVSAPDSQKSGSSHSVTLRRPIMVKKTKMPSGAIGHAVSGTPSDACRVGYTLYNDPTIDLIISGVNDDTNLAYDTNYSGTVGAALEASCAGFPVMAISVANDLPYDWELVGRLVAKAVELYPSWKIPIGVALNINIPSKLKSEEFVWVRPHKATPYDFLDVRRIDDDTLECTRHREKAEHLEHENSDVWYFVKGYISISPIVPVGVHEETLLRLAGMTPNPK